MKEEEKKLTVREALPQVVIVLLLQFLPLIVAWRWDWWEAWLFGVTTALAFAISRFLAGRRHPGLLTERARSMKQENAQEWDRKLAPFVALGGSLILIVAGLDDRFDWSPTYSLANTISSYIVILIGYGISSYALIENRFFSGLVRIQDDRGHYVIDSGPYRWIRHPGYAGAVLANLATPCLLNSVWAFIPAVLITAIMVYRTSLEDAFLQTTLTGYREYAGRVRYRLLPAVW